MEMKTSRNNALGWCLASLLLLVLDFVGSSQAVSFEPDQDAMLDFCDIVTKYGYPLEDHYVTTEDGYVLRMFRIRPKPGEVPMPAPKPVLVMHGLLGSAENFIFMGPSKSLAYQLADAGYDVWVGNARGTMHSRNHTTMDPDTDATFWKFSWHEIGSLDLPAMIDHILATTNQSRVHYIGHSQGTTSLVVMLSERPEYNEKVKVPILLAPSVYQGNMPNRLLTSLAAVGTQLYALAQSLQLHEIIPRLKEIQHVAYLYCKSSNRTMATCANFLTDLGGRNVDQFDERILLFIVSKVPGGSSVIQPLHYAQLIRSGRFEPFDYGRSTNMKKYGRRKPREYTLENITAPIALFIGDNDMLVSKLDIQKLVARLRNVVKLRIVKDKMFSHMDFLWAKDAVPLVYKDIIKVMKKYDRKFEGRNYI